MIENATIIEVGVGFTDVTEEILLKDITAMVISEFTGLRVCKKFRVTISVEEEATTK